MAKLLWVKEHNTNICYEIFAVPKLNAVFYLNGSTNDFAGLRIWKYDLKTGKELASFLTRSIVYSLAFSPDFSEVMANTQRKLFLLSTDKLELLHRCDSRVPSIMRTMIHLGRTAAMKGTWVTDVVVNMYDLDTSKVRRIKVGEGDPLFRDVYPNKFLACCGVDGNIWRIDANTYDKTELLAGFHFDSSAIDYKNEKLWLSEATSRKRTESELAPFGRPNNRLRTLSLRDPSDVQKFELPFECFELSVSNDGKFLWVGRDAEYDHVRAIKALSVLSVANGLKETEQFKVPKSEIMRHFDASAGLIFTEKRYFKETRVEIKCWQL